ncbi:MAG: radical SAM family heme chaperone HemW [Spirochaetaceae bacterium]|nr:radical SAM family heme chaperone HemW [Spirochaetaceae bacterium]
MTAALYIHIPFCAKKCDYCDFYSIPVDVEADGKFIDGFFDKLCRDISRQLKSFRVSGISSVYIGGGTPSLPGPARMRRLLDFLRPLLAEMGGCGEFTVEANPESLDEDFLRVCAEGGVTRISCGIQSFDSNARHALGRQGEVSALHSALSLLAGIYQGAFSADLISALPGQDEASLLGDIETLLPYGPAHISLYDLTLEENTPLHKNVMLGCVALPPPEKAENLWIAGRDLLEAKGYAQYEVSNFAKSGGRCLHNLVYWRMGCWLGAGPSASGTVIYETPDGVYGERRVTEPCAVRYASEADARFFVERLDRGALIKESFLMGFRCTCGPDGNLFKKRFNRPVESLAPETFRLWRERGLMSEDAAALNSEGLLLLNRFLTDCFLEMDKSPGVFL